MLRTGGTSSRFLLLAAPLALLAVLLLGGVSSAAVVSHLSAPGPQVSINGSWTITTAVSYSDTSIQVNGSVYIEAGGSLTLQNVTLSLSEPSSLDHGITVVTGGGLYATDSTVESVTPANHLWVRANAGAHVSITGGLVQDLGGSAGPDGFDVDASGATINGVTFNSYYEALVVSATDVTVENCVFEATTSTASGTYVVSTSGTSSGFVMTHSRIVDTTMAGGALFVTSAADIENNTFTLDPHGTNPTPILIGYSGGDGFVNASHTKFVYNTVSGSDVVDYDSSDVTISHNLILNSGGQQYIHDYGVHAEVFDPSGKGVWINGLSIEDNYISNASGYGIRVEQNITNVVIAHNDIVNCSTSPLAGEYNGVETYVGIYLIRGVTHALVEDNYIDNSVDQEMRTITTAGFGLESEVDYSTIANNTVLNTDLGIWVQGDWNDGPGNIGPSLHNTVTGNTFRNTLPIVETADLASAIQNYDWANYTTISDNLIEGWNMVPSGVGGYEGEAIMQADDYGSIFGNVVNGATYGIEFGYFYGQSSNASYNVAYDNSFNVTDSAIADDTASTGTIVNVINLLSAHSTSSGFPTSDLQSIGPVGGVGFSGSSGVFSATLATVNPATGMMANFTSSIPWSVANFSVWVSGDLGKGTLSAAVTHVNSTAVTYSLVPSGTLYHSVGLAVPAQNYSASYTVREVVRGITTETFTVDSSTGPASFETNGTGSLSVAIGLDSWVAKPTNTTVSLELSVTTSNGTPVGGIFVHVGLNESSRATTLALGPTDSTGGVEVTGLPSGTTVTNLTVEGSNYTLGSYSVVTPSKGLIQLNVVVVPPVGPVGNNTTAPPTYPVQFMENGLPSGSAWWVSVTGPQSANVTLSVATITFNLPSGAYRYAFGTLTNESPTTPPGSFALPGVASPIFVNFSAAQPTGPGSPPPGATPSTPANLVSWGAAAIYLFAASVLALLIFGVYMVARNERKPLRPFSWVGSSVGKICPCRAPLHHRRRPKG